MLTRWMTAMLAGTLALSGGALARTEILWDTWGVPHIYAQNTPALFRAFGWAQARAHGNLVLRLYGQARGRASEYWGEGYLQGDRLVHAVGTNRMGDTWYARQTPAFQKNLDAFAEGINDYARAHPNAIGAEWRRVLPVSARDVMAHTARLMFTFQSMSGGSELAGLLPQIGTEKPGSNGWAVAPRKSASGHALLLANPHLAWGDLFTFFEGQLSAPGYSTYGATLVGIPVNAIAFNDRLGWTHTVNTIDTTDAYRLEPRGAGYLLDGKLRAFQERQVTLNVRRPDGSLRSERLTLRSSVHGPVVGAIGKHPVAIRVGGITQDAVTGVLEQWWAMGKARTLADFQRAIRRDQLPLFNVIYADADGHTLLHHAGKIPARPGGTWLEWYGLVPGTTSERLWTRTRTFDERPTVLNPASGYLQNANEMPWFVTTPGAPNPRDFALDIAPPLGIPSFGTPDFRAQRSHRMILQDASITLDELVAYKHDTHLEMTDHVLDDLIRAGRALGGDAAAAAEVLARWDRRAAADSRGTLLFLMWAQANAQGMFSHDLYATPWSAGRLLDTPRGLRNPQQAAAVLAGVAAQIRRQHGRLDVPWGDVMRFRAGTVDVPGNGAPGQFGVFRVMNVEPQPDGRLAPVYGDTYVAAVEFGKKVRARVLMTYGNASQPGSRHVGDQLTLARDQALRDAWLDRTDVERHTLARDTF